MAQTSPRITSAHSCTCGTPGRIHAAGCGCEIAAEFLAEPAARFHYSRRELLLKALVGGMTLSALPLLLEDAHADAFKPSAAQQMKLGDQAAAQVLQKYPVVKDDRAREFSRVGEKLVNALTPQERGPWNYTFRVVESKEINAFALPGGNMFMFTGLLERIKSSSELAAVTGHEMTHVRKEHWANAAAAQKKRELGLGVILGLSRAGQLWQTIAGAGEQLYTLKFSRSEEDQADAGGLQNMAEAGFNLHGMIDLFNTLQQATGGKGGGPEFLSDHPLTTARIKHTEQRIAQMEAKNPSLRDNSSTG